MKIILSTFILIVCISTNLQAQFNFSGKIRTIRPITLFLVNIDGDTILRQDIKSSTPFETKTISIHDDYYTLHLGKFKKPLILGNNPVTLKGFLDDHNVNITDLVFEGAPLSDELAQATSGLNFKSGAEILASLKETYHPLVQAAVVYWAKDRISSGYEQIANLTRKLSETESKSLLSQKIEQIASLMKQNNVGSRIQSVILPDQNGKLVDISDFSGKLVLVDFWASWCGPCRAEMKNLKKLYEEIKGDDLVFISISLDEDKDKWLKALDVEQIPWITLWDNGGIKNSELRLQFGFSSIPFIALIGKDGSLLARQLRGKNIQPEIEKYRTIK